MNRVRAAGERRARGQHGDEGTILLLTLGFTVVALLLVLVVAAATEVHLERMRLTHVADEVALDAADSLDIAAYYAGDASEPSQTHAITLAARAVDATARERVAAAATRASLPPTAVIEATTPDGFTATVTVSTTVHPLFGIDALLPFADGVTLTATSSARAN